MGFNSTPCGSYRQVPSASTSNVSLYWETLVIDGLLGRALDV